MSTQTHGSGVAWKAALKPSLTGLASHVQPCRVFTHSEPRQEAEGAALQARRAFQNPSQEFSYLLVVFCCSWAALGCFLMAVRQFCSILLEAGLVKIDVRRLSSRGKKLCAQALAAYLLCHGCWVPAKHPRCSAVLEALCSQSKRQGRDPTQTHSTAPLQDNPSIAAWAFGAGLGVAAM